MIENFFAIYGKAFEAWNISFTVYGFSFSFFDLFLAGMIVSGIMIVLFAIFGGGGGHRRS